MGLKIYKTLKMKEKKLKFELKLNYRMMYKMKDEANIKDYY
jgi:hypothetical protein